MFNHYGPTETTVGVTTLRGSATSSFPGPKVPIGWPLPGATVFVLDGTLELVPLAVDGELFVGGEQVARGYLARPSLTAAAYLPDPFSRQPGGRLYRTGDRVRRLKGGEIEFLGRFDHQVKIRGFRVEIGEVEAVLARHPQVAAAVVVNRPEADGPPRLVAYFEMKPDAEVGATPAEALESLPEFLRRELPEPMMPAVLMPLEALPRTRQGKLDFNALPEPEGKLSPRTVFRPPTTENERRVAAIWTEVLGLDSVGLDDNFFELGGHSLRAVQAVSRIRQTFGRDLRLIRMFENPTIAGIVGELERSREAQDTAITRVSRRGRRMKRDRRGALLSQEEA